MTTDREMSLRFERSGNPAWGLFGGQTGAPPKASSTPHPCRRLLNTQPHPPPRRRRGQLLHHRRRGYGNPHDRNPQAVLDDLADGHISPTYARHHHRLNPQDLTRG